MLRLFISPLLFLGLTAQAQFQFSKKQLIGTWEIDYGSLKACDDGFVKPIQKIGQSTITFVDSSTYNANTWGVYSIGFYSIDEMQGDIIFDPIPDATTINLKQKRIKVMSVTDDTLTILLADCDVLYEQTYFKVNTKEGR